MEKRDLGRYIRVTGFVIVALYAALMSGAYTQQGGEVHDLANALGRRAPITEYQQAESYHTNCRMNYEDAFMAAIGAAITIDRTDPAVTIARAEIVRLATVLAHIESHCPTPIAPTFAEDGDLLTPPVLPTTTTSTTTPFNILPPTSG